MYTNNYKLPLLFQNQAMKEILHNESLNKIDLILNKVVIDFVEVLPSEPAECDIYIMAGNLQCFSNGAWLEITPQKNMIFFVLSKKQFFVFDEEWNAI